MIADITKYDVLETQLEAEKVRLIEAFRAAKPAERRGIFDQQKLVNEKLISIRCRRGTLDFIDWLDSNPKYQRTAVEIFTAMAGQMRRAR